MIQFRFFILLLTVFIMSGCADHYASLSYKSEIGSRECNGQVIKVDRVLDRRNEDDPLRYGTVRGGYGNPLKKLKTEKSITDDVHAMFEQALIKRGCTLDEKSPFLLKPEIFILGADYLMNREARCKIGYALITKDKKVVYENESFKQNSEITMGAGIFADVEHFKNYIDTTVSQCIDNAVDDKELWKSLAEYKPSSTDIKLSGKDRLIQLKEMLDSGLITHLEFDAKKREVIDSL